MQTDDEKLLEILQENDVRISNKGNICLNDFVKNIIESKNPNAYIKKLEDCNKIEINGKYYVSSTDCVKILENAKFKKCKQIYTKIQIIDGDNESIIDVDNQIFQFEGHRFSAFFVQKMDDDWDVWIRASEAARVLGYQNDKQAIRENVDDDNKMNFAQLVKTFTMLPKNTTQNLDKKTIFINLSGFFNLIHTSNKPLAKKIKKWLDNEVIPSLIKYGTYTMQPKDLKKSFIL